MHTLRWTLVEQGVPPPFLPSSVLPRRVVGLGQRRLLRVVRCDGDLQGVEHHHAARGVPLQLGPDRGLQLLDGDDGVGLRRESGV